MSLELKIRKRLAEVKPSKMYSPEQIVEMKLILNTQFKPSLHKIYRLIKRGSLPAMNLGDKQPRWFVQGKDLRIYVESIFSKINSKIEQKNGKGKKTKKDKE